MAALAYEIRRSALFMVHRANASHIGGSLSCADILAVLYGAVMNVRPDDPCWPERDRFILSKGHCCAALYAALAHRGFLPVEELDEYGQSGSRLMCHASHKVPGVEWSTGSLGHGLGLGCGQALAARKQGRSWRVFVLLSDGELDEGSTWEAILFAGHHALDNLTVVVDKNGQQALGRSDSILDLRDVAEKFRAFGWRAHDADGHDVRALLQALGSRPGVGKPRCIVAQTVKGKGVAYMEDQMEWHYRAPKTQEALDRALEQLAEHYGRSR